MQSICIFFQLTVQVNDGGDPSMEAQVEVTVIILRNFFAPEVEVGQATTLNLEVLEIATVNTPISTIRLQDQDRRVRFDKNVKIL